MNLVPLNTYLATEKDFEHFLGIISAKRVTIQIFSKFLLFTLDIKQNS